MANSRKRKDNSLPALRPSNNPLAKRKHVLRLVPPPAPAATNVPSEREVSSRLRNYARLMLLTIERDFAGADFVTREDLLQARAFQHVSTITRYSEVCHAVSELLRQGKLIAKSRTDLCLPDRVGRYKEDTPLAGQYAATIRRLLLSKRKEGSFSVMDIVSAWRTDQHLTVNNKRVAVRGALKKFVHDKLIQVNDDYEYEVI